MPNKSIEELLAIIRFGVDQVALEQVKRAAEAVEKGLLRDAAAAGEAKQQLTAARMEARKLQQVGTTLGMAGAAIMAPFLLAAREYRQSVGLSEEASRRWTTAQERLKDVQIRVGRETTEILVPLMEKGADLAEKFANLIERNPGLLKGILAVGGGLAAAGTVVTLIAQVQKLIANVQLLSMGSGVGGMVGKTAGALINPYTGIAAAVGLGAYATYSGIAQSQLGQARNMQAAPAQMATTVAYGLGHIFGGPELAAKWGKSIGELTGAIEKVDQATGDLSDTMEDTTASAMEIYLNYVRAERDAAAEFEQRRAEMVRSFNQQQAQELADFNRSRQQLMRDFYRSERQAEAAYYRNRTIAAQRYSVEVQRSEEDHQRRMRRLQQDYAATMEELIAEGDALGMVRATRDYERQRREADEEYQIAARRRSEDFAREMAEQAAQFAAARAQRLADMQQRLIDEREQFNIRRRLAQQQHRQQLADMQQQFNEERIKRRQAMIDQLRDLSEGLSTALRLWGSFTGSMIAALQRAAAEAGIPIKLPTRHAGGYTTDAAYRMQAGEFVLNRQTTSAAERLAGGRLDQDKILSLLAGSGGAGKTVVYYDQRHFNSRLSSEEIKEIRRGTEMMLGEVFGDA